MAEKTTIDIPGKVSQLLTRSDNEISIHADQVVLPEADTMLVRFKLEGRVVSPTNALLGGCRTTDIRRRKPSGLLPCVLERVALV